MSLNVHFLVGLDHIFFWNIQTFKISSKTDADAAADLMGLNDNDKEPGEINKNYDVTDGQEPGYVFTNSDVTDADTDYDMGLNYYANPKQNNAITGNQYYHSALTERTGDSKK